MTSFLVRHPPPPMSWNVMFQLTPSPLWGHDVICEWPLCYNERFECWVSGRVRVSHCICLRVRVGFDFIGFGLFPRVSGFRALDFITTPQVSSQLFYLFLASFLFSYVLYTLQKNCQVCSTGYMWHSHIVIKKQSVKGMALEKLCNF